MISLAIGPHSTCSLAAAIVMPTLPVAIMFDAVFLVDCNVRSHRRAMRRMACTAALHITHSLHRSSCKSGGVG